MSEEKQWVEVDLPIEYPYNPGEWRLSRLDYGPRGGKKWTRLTHGLAATGGIYRTQLQTNTIYKVTYWSNGWPTATTFTVDENGEIAWEEK